MAIRWGLEKENYHLWISTEASEPGCTKSSKLLISNMPKIPPQIYVSKNHYFPSIMFMLTYPHMLDPPS
jgi:hypothetical protein